MLLSSEDYATGELFPALFGLALCFSATGVLGLSIGTFLRNSAGADPPWHWVCYFCRLFSVCCSATYSVG